MDFPKASPAFFVLTIVFCPIVKKTPASHDVKQEKPNNCSSKTAIIN